MNVMVGIIVVGFLVLLAIPVVIAVVRVARRWSVEKRSPLGRAEARVVEKRTELAGGRPSDQRYYVTFEFATGDRLELDVPGRESGMLVVGDQGTLGVAGSPLPRLRPRGASLAQDFGQSNIGNH